MTPLSRRFVLRGLGACVGLPLLDAMIPSTAHAAGGPRRFVLVYHPNGASMPAWTPTGAGPGWVAGPSLAPLAPVRADVAVISGLDNVRSGVQLHASLLRTLISEYVGEDPSGYPIAGRSFDRMLADHIGGGVAFPHLALASEGGTSCSGPSHCEWLVQLSWDAPGLPVTPDLAVTSVFDRLFGGAGEAPEARARRQRLGQSVLDAVIADADALSARLGGPDRARLDEHLTAIRELERRLWLPPADPGACGATPPDPGADPTAQVEAMMEVIALALACDRSRVVSHMISMGESYRALAFLGHPIAHHSASHVDPVAHEAVATWSVERFAWLVARLGRQVDPDGVSLLDRTLLMYTSDMSVGLQHDHRDLPVLLAGRGLAGVPLGEHVVLPEGTPLHDLLLAILQGYGAPVTAFGARGTTPALPLG